MFYIASTAKVCFVCLSVPLTAVCSFYPRTMKNMPANPPTSWFAVRHWRRRFRSLAFFARQLAIILFICLMPGVSAADKQGERYTLGPLDWVRVKVYEWRASRDEVFEWKALNDQFAIGPEGTLSLPLIGEVEAAGLNTVELCQRIAERFRERMGFAEPPSVSVEVVKFRPFYIVGDVHAPGEFPYRPGLTVLQALSLAGGFYRGAENAQRIDRDSIAAKGELSLVNVGLIQEFARRARLEAEQRGDNEVKYPAALMQRKSVASLSQLMQQEDLVFETRRRGYETEVKALEELSTFLRSEITSIESQIQTQNRQLELARKELQGVQTLMDKGLSNASRSLGVQRNVAQLEGERLVVVSSLSRARQELSKTELSIIALRNKRANDIALELSQTQSKIDELAQKYDMNERLLIEADVVARSRTMRTEPELLPRYAIVRLSATGSNELPADEATELQPGDTVKVTLPLPQMRAVGDGGALLGPPPQQLVQPSADLGLGRGSSTTE